MVKFEWHDAVEKVEPLIFRIFTPSGSGSGFLVSRSTTSTVVAVATALHVVEHEHIWNEPIRIEHYKTGRSFFLKSEDRAILFDKSQDTAAILFDAEDLNIEEEIPDLLESEKIIKTGVEVGWLGFPAVSSGELCFFSGRISSSIENGSTYLVDGVAINGVSGGPAVWLGYNEIKYMGVVSAYIPNRSTGETLPGLAVIQHVIHFHDVAKRMQSVDEAKEKEKEIAPKPEAPDEIDENQSQES